MSLLISDSNIQFTGYENSELTVEKAFLSECLQKRLPNLADQHDQWSGQKYETQIVITRISIKCDCDNLESNEVCSKLNSVENQKWTGYMGNNGNGIYPN